MAKLKNKVVRIISDNENYVDYLDKDLIIIDAYKEGYFYDSSMNGMYLCDLEVLETGEEVPFALYEYEFTVL